MMKTTLIEPAPETFAKQVADMEEGDTFVIRYNGETHVGVRVYQYFVSLTNPRKTWSPGSVLDVVRRCEIEVIAR